MEISYIIWYTYSMRKFFLILALLTVIFTIACKKEVKEVPLQENVILWNVYSYPDYNAKIYLKLDNDKLSAIICGSANKIVGRINLEHSCSEKEFATIQKKLLDRKLIEEEKVREPIIDGYPDMTAYLPMVLTDEKQEEIWNALIEE